MSSLKSLSREAQESSSRSSSALSYYLSETTASDTSSPRYSHITLESERDPHLRLREREIEEARSIRKTLESIDKNERDELYTAAEREAQRLVIKHKHPHALYRPTDELKQPRTSTVRASNTQLKSDHQRDESVDLDDLIASYSPEVDTPQDDYFTSTKHVAELNQDVGADAVQADSTHASQSEIPDSKREGGPAGPAGVASLTHQLSSKLSLNKLASRRRSSGTKRHASNGTRASFPNEQDKIYEDPSGEKTATSKAGSINATASHVRRNPFTRAQSARQGDATMMHDRTWHRTEIQKNQPSRSRDPEYRRNPVQLESPPDMPSKQGATNIKDGFEVRGDDIRAATSRRRGERSQKLPSPSAVSNKPGCPIVSFDPHWKPKDMGNEFRQPGRAQPFPSSNRDQLWSAGGSLPSDSTSCRARPPPIGRMPEPSLFELLGEQSPEVLGVEQLTGKACPSLERRDGATRSLYEEPTQQSIPSIVIGVAAEVADDLDMRGANVADGLTYVKAEELSRKKGETPRPGPVERGAAVPLRQTDEKVTVRQPSRQRVSLDERSTGTGRPTEMKPSLDHTTARQSWPVGGVPMIAINDDEATPRKAGVPLGTRPVTIPSIEVEEATPSNTPTATPRKPTAAGGHAAQAEGVRGEGRGARLMPSDSTAAPHSPRSHYTPYQLPGGTLCAQCALPISGRVVGAAGTRFHPECFSCHRCRERLECVAFYPEPDDERNERLQRMQQRCAGQEGTSPDDAQNDEDDSLRFYCHLDFHELFSPRCKSCKTPIEGEVIVACGGEWHVGHFFCAQCGDVGALLVRSKTMWDANWCCSRSTRALHLWKRTGTRGACSATTTASAASARAAVSRSRNACSRRWVGNGMCSASAATSAATTLPTANSSCVRWTACSVPCASAASSVD